MSDIKGVSPDTEIVTNKDGGKQSKSSYGFHLMDDGAMLALAEVLQIGATRYERDNWRKIPSEEHFNHMMVHYYAWKSGDTSDDHLGHMFCRAMMLYATGKAEMIDFPFASEESEPTVNSLTDFEKVSANLRKAVTDCGRSLSSLSFGLHKCTDKEVTDNA